MTAEEVLLDAAKTYRERHVYYGNNSPKVGGALAAMFPEGLTLRTPQDFTRFYLFVLAIMKASRYANNITKAEGHKDSAHDLCVYAAMLEANDNG